MPARDHGDAPPCALYLNRKAGATLTETERHYAATLRGRGLPVFDRGDRDDADRFLNEVLRRSVPTLIVSGGDGTLNVVLNACDRAAAAESWPRIALLPGGTTNLLSRRLHLPALRKHIQLLEDMDLGAADLPTLPVRTLRLGDQVGLLCGMGYIERASTQFTSSDASKGTDLAVWTAAGILRAVLGLGRVEWLEGGHQDAPRTAEGLPIRLPGGGLPSGGVFSAEPRISAVWEHPSLSHLEGIHSMLSGGESGPMLRHGIAGVFRLRRRSPLIRVAVDQSLLLPPGQRIMLDGEYRTLEEDTPLRPGPIFRILHPTLPVRGPIRVMPLPLHG